MKALLQSTNLATVLLSAQILLSAATETIHIRGEILTAGSPEKRQTWVSAEPDNHKVTVCPGPRVSELIQLTGTIISISGQMRKAPSAKDNCVAVESFEVHEIAKGRPAFIGVLKLIEKNKYTIVGDNGKSWPLSKIPPGLKSLINTRIICDLVASDTDGETSWLVARAFSLPAPP
jgi:hypothetical protein